MTSQGLGHAERTQSRLKETGKWCVSNHDKEHSRFLQLAPAFPLPGVALSTASIRGRLSPIPQEAQGGVGRKPPLLPQSRPRASCTQAQCELVIRRQHADTKRGEDCPGQTRPGMECRAQGPSALHGGHRKTPRGCPDALGAGWVGCVGGTCGTCVGTRWAVTRARTAASVSSHSRRTAASGEKAPRTQSVRPAGREARRLAS